MLKYAAIAILFLGCTYIGFYYGEKFKKRCKALADIKKAVMFLNTEVMYYNTPLPEAFNNIGLKLPNPLDNLFKEMAYLLREDQCESVYHVFNQVYDNYQEELKLKEGDRRILDDFFKSLGGSGIYGQEKVFKLAAEEIDLNYGEAEVEAKKNIKMYRTLGICSGAILAIFFI